MDRVNVPVRHAAAILLSLRVGNYRRCALCCVCHGGSCLHEKREGQLEQLLVHRTEIDSSGSPHIEEPYPTAWDKLLPWWTLPYLQIKQL